MPRSTGRPVPSREDDTRSMFRQFRLPLCLLLSGLCSSASSQDAAPRTPIDSRKIVSPNAGNPQRLITPRRETPSSQETSRLKKEPFSIWRTLGVLTFVVAGIIGGVKVMKHLGPFGTMKPLPGSVCEVLGMTTLPNRHTLYILRVGQRILLVGSSGEHLATLAEFTEPHDVASIVGLCNTEAQSADGNISFFSRLLNQSFAAESTTPSPSSEDSPARQELEARLNSFANS